MKYSMVKQFSNGALDNVYNFFFKIVDFGKLLWEAMWGLFEIFMAFFLIFWNIIMYFYYLFLFIVDRGAEESGGRLKFWRKRSGTVSSVPKINLTKSANPIPAQYRSAKAAVTKTADAVSSAATTAKETVMSTGSPFKQNAGAKTNIFKTAGEAIVEFFSKLFGWILLPFKGIVNFFEDKLKPVKEGDHPAEPKNRSLIDEYLKEYELKKK